MAYLELKNICKSYGFGANRTEVLKDINLSIEEGEFVSIVGFTGSGKTTLVNLIIGLEKPTSGEILFKGKPIDGTSHERGIIFQNYSLLPWLNVEQNVLMGVKGTFPKESIEKQKSIVADYLNLVGLTPAIHKFPRELSGGMKQRVSIARTLAMNPEMIVMDEPMGALDALTRGKLQDEILKIWENNKQTVLLITNDVDEGIYMSDRIIPLTPGPNATLGPEYKIYLDRPRDKTELNDDWNYQETRNTVMQYLIAIGKGRKKSLGKVYSLPDVLPEI